MTRKRGETLLDFSDENSILTLILIKTPYNLYVSLCIIFLVLQKPAFVINLIESKKILKRMVEGMISLKKVLQSSDVELIQAIPSVLEVAEAFVDLEAKNNVLHQLCSGSVDDEDVAGKVVISLLQ